MKMKIATIATAAMLASAWTASASLTISSVLGGSPTGVNKLNFDDLSLGVVTSATAATPNGSVTITTTPDAAVVSGSLSGVYAAPVLSGGNGNGFAAGNGNQANGTDTTRYLTSGRNGASTPLAAVTLQFSTLQQYFGLLWGSIDTYNTLSFYNGATLVGTATGSDVAAFPTGNQGVNGTKYVNINSTLGFDRVVATSTSYAFEFDNVAYSETPIPEPTTVIAGGLLLLPFAASMLRTLRRKRTA